MRLAKLLEVIQRYLDGKASPAEEKAIDKWYESAERKIPENLMLDPKMDALRERSFQNILSEIDTNAPQIPFYKKAGFRAAAAIVLLLGITMFFYVLNRNVAKQESQTTLSNLQNDIAPPKDNKAVLTLADGTKIDLDSTGNGTLAMQGNVQVIKKSNGLIEYTGQAAEMAYNTLYVPVGSKPQKLALADGSQVWLNVASSIRFPVAFNGNERRVEITGEAYFEIAKNPAQPFVVTKPGSNTSIKVLGTHFNVNAYDDEAMVKVTLLEGSVDVNGNNTSTILKPGQQARVNSGSAQVVDNVDLEEVMAWKDGRFYFDGADMRTIMRQIEKWYDVEVQYEAEPKDSFVAKISRDVNVSELLTILESTDLVHFKVQGKKITVME